MLSRQVRQEAKSWERLAFEHYLRTRRRLAPSARTVEQKFNPYHDPRNGQFTFAPGHPNALANAMISDRRGLSRPKRNEASAHSVPVHRPTQTVLDENPAATLQPANARPNPRARIGNNRGPALNDPLILSEVFPALRNAPGGAIVAATDNILDITGPGRRLTEKLASRHANQLIRQIRTIDPDYSYQSPGFSRTIEGQANLIKRLRFDRAVAFYRVRGETRPLQVEVLRVMQRRADTAYQEAVVLYEAGRLSVRLSREEAIGNYVDLVVRRSLRGAFNVRGVDTSRGQQVRVVGREYDSSGSDLTYRIPDAVSATSLSTSR